MLERAGACLGARARQGVGKVPVGSHPTEGRARRGLPVARPWGVGRGEPILLREHRRAAPRVLTLPKELTKGCLWGGSAPPNGSRLSCGRNGRGRKVVEQQRRRLAGEATQFFPTCARPAASSAC